jgi:hypothetical protein
MGRCKLLVLGENLLLSLSEDELSAQGEPTIPVWITSHIVKIN